jgi:carboxyl-terminal processing protease
MSTKRVIIFLSLFAVLAGSVFVGGFYLGKSKIQRTTLSGLNSFLSACQKLENTQEISSAETSLFVDACQELKKPGDLDFSLFWEAWQQIEKSFVNKDKIDVKKMISGAISGMVESLGDPYTVFLPPDESKRFKEEVKGVFGGVGMEIGIKDGQLQVVSPLEGTPAKRAGLRAGDKILEVNGTSTAGMSIEVAVNIIRGPRGTNVNLKISREGWNSPKDFNLIRDTIEIPSLKLEFKDLPGGEQAAYLALYQFSEKANYDFNAAAVNILNSPAKKIILDLRNNPGGYLEVAQAIAGWFLQKGQAVAIEDFGGGKEKINYDSNGPSLLADYPLVVLINQGSASAAEILAGALRDNRNILLIGEKSFGKGSVQELFDLSGGSSLKITVAKWLTPSGTLLTEVGLEPDVMVEMAEKDYEQSKDLQLERAIDILGKMR